MFCALAVSYSAHHLLSRTSRPSQARPCHIGDLCASVSEGLYAELTLTVDIGFDENASLSLPTAHRDTAAAAMVAAAEAAKVHPSSWEGMSVAEMRWRRRMGDALGGAVATRLEEACGVLPGDVAFSLLSSGGVGGDDVNGVGGDAQLDVVLASIHLLDSTAESPEKVQGCVSRLSNPAIARELTSIVDEQMLERAEAGGEGGAGGGGGSGGWAAWGLSAKPAEGLRVVETGRVFVRTAPNDLRVIDNNAVEGAVGGGGGDLGVTVGKSGGTIPRLHQQEPQKQQQGQEEQKQAVDIERRTGRSDSGSLGSAHPGESKQSLSMVNNPWPESGFSPNTVFAFQALGMIVLVGLLLLAQRCRSHSRGGGLASTWPRRRGGGGGGSPTSAEGGGDAVRYRRKNGTGQGSKGEHSA